MGVLHVIGRAFRIVFAGQLVPSAGKSLRVSFSCLQEIFLIHFQNPWSGGLRPHNRAHALEVVIESR